MGTRSVIGVMHGDKVKTAYCHWDGYVDHNGRILLEHYDSSKANHLVALGDMSSLRPEIGEKHIFSVYEQVDAEGKPMKEDNPEYITKEMYDERYSNMTTFYGRDRGETGVDFQVCFSDTEMYEKYEWCEYFYIMKDGVWFVSEGANSEWKVLNDAVRELDEPGFKAPSVTRFIGMLEA